MKKLKWLVGFTLLIVALALGGFTYYTRSKKADFLKAKVQRGDIEITEDPFRQSRDVFEKHRLPLSIGAHHQIMKAERQLNDGIKPWERPVARPHLFHQNSAMS